MSKVQWMLAGEEGLEMHMKQRREAGMPEGQKAAI